MGCAVERINTPCDLVVEYKGRVFLLEVKSKDGKKTPIQKESPFKSIMVVRSPEQAFKKILDL